MKRYAVLLKHDAGYVVLNVSARDVAGAKRIVMAVENCPEGAILEVKFDGVC